MVPEDYANAAAETGFEETQDYHCTDYGRAEQFAETTAEPDTASAAEHDWHTQNSTHRSDSESVGIAREPRTVSKDPQF